MTKALQPYLHFDGNCQEAMEFYQSILGGKLKINRYSDYASPEQKANMDKTQAEGVMHSTLENDSLTFMASDALRDNGVTIGDNVSLSIAGDDTEALTKYFEGLSAGGQMMVPLEKQMWGDMFGMFTDKYGIHWMINITSTPGAADSANQDDTSN